MERKIWSFCSFPFCLLRNNKKDQAPKVLSEELSLKSCPLGHEYDADLHDAIAHLRILDGSLPEDAKLVSGLRAVNFFCARWDNKVLGEVQLTSVWLFLLLHSWHGYLPLPCLNLWNANLASHQRGRGGRTFECRSPSVSNATLCFGHALRAVMQSFPGVWTRMGRNSRIFFFSTRRCCILWMTFSGTWASKAQNTLRRWWTKLLKIVILQLL